MNMKTNEFDRNKGTIQNWERQIDFERSREIQKEIESTERAQKHF